MIKATLFPGTFSHSSGWGEERPGTGWHRVAIPFIAELSKMVMTASNKASSTQKNVASNGYICFCRL